MEWNKWLTWSFVLGVVQYLIFIARFDYLITLGVFVTHHFVELPAVFIFGMGIYQLLEDNYIQWHGYWDLIAIGLFVLLVFRPQNIVVRLIIYSPFLPGYYSKKWANRKHT